MLSLFLLACATLQPAKVPTQNLWLDDGTEHVASGPVRFAVVGDMRSPLSTDLAKGRVATPETEARVVRDISDAVQRGEVDAVVLLGDMVQFSATRQWQRFSHAWAPLLSGSEPAEEGRLRVRTLPVSGNHEHYNDPTLVGFGAAFPGVGQDIGYGRVAGWWQADVVSRAIRWRFIGLDSDRGAMGTRWDDQQRWLAEALQGDYDRLVVFMHHPRYTLADKQVPDTARGPSDLLSTIEDGTKIGQLVAVFAGHAHTNEVYLPGGPLGEIYVVAGGGGSPADTLARHGTVSGKELHLEPAFDLALHKAISRWVDAKGLPGAALDQAKGEGTWKGFTPSYDAGAMPVQGWWQMELDGRVMNLSFRMIGPDGSLAPVYGLRHEARDGWKVQQPGK
jgi:hypothetical protein